IRPARTTRRRTSPRRSRLVRRPPSPPNFALRTRLRRGSRHPPPPRPSPPSPPRPLLRLPLQWLPRLKPHPATRSFRRSHHTSHERSHRFLNRGPSCFLLAAIRSLLAAIPLSNPKKLPLR